MHLPLLLLLLFFSKRSRCDSSQTDPARWLCGSTAGGVSRVGV